MSWSRALLVLAFAVVPISCNSAPRPLAGSAPELSRFTKSSNALAFDLTRQALGRPGNVALSPLGVSSALTVLWQSAAGETKAEIQRVLHAEGPSATALQTAREIGESLAASGRATSFTSATRLFVDKGVAAPAAGPLAALVEPTDFTAPDAARQSINGWIAGRTQGQARDLLPPGAISTSAALVVAAADHFRGRWKTPFPAESTKPGRFQMSPSEAIEVPMMHHEHKPFRSAWLEKVHVVELPYQGDELAMLLVVPQEGQELAAVEAELSPATLDRWIALLSLDDMDVALPRFQVTSGGSLVEGLRALGMRRALGGDAELPQLARPGVFIDVFEHRVHLELDEAGTKAWSVTWGRAVKGAARPFRAERPFLFFLREVRSGLLLLMGRVSDPRQ